MNRLRRVAPALAAIVTSLVFAVSYAKAPTPVQPQQVGSATAPSTKPKNKPQTLATIIVTTGTRALNIRATQSLSPISVITPKQLASTGAPNLLKALRVLLPSLNLTIPSTIDQAAASHPAQLRGLSPDDTLVLIDGKREHPSSVLKNELISFQTGSTGTDLSAIPMNAVERVEVLRDGAAAQYGSDAIAGVINIILKGERKGARYTLNTGNGLTTPTPTACKGARPAQLRWATSIKAGSG